MATTGAVATLSNGAKRQRVDANVVDLTDSASPLPARVSISAQGAGPSAAGAGGMTSPVLEKLNSAQIHAMSLIRQPNPQLQEYFASNRRPSYSLSSPPPAAALPNAAANRNNAQFNANAANANASANSAAVAAAAVAPSKPAQPPTGPASATLAQRIHTAIPSVPIPPQLKPLMNEGFMRSFILQGQTVEPLNNPGDPQRLAVYNALIAYRNAVYQATGIKGITAQAVQNLFNSSTAAAASAATGAAAQPANAGSQPNITGSSPMLAPKTSTPSALPVPGGASTPAQATAAAVAAAGSPALGKLPPHLKIPTKPEEPIYRLSISVVDARGVKRNVNVQAKNRKDDAWIDHIKTPEL
jgi:hypothetical protein